MFNKLPDKGHQPWHLVKEEFESKWCKTAVTSNLIALLSTDNLIDLRSAADSSLFLEKDANHHYSHPCVSTTIPPHFFPILKYCLPILSNFLAAREVYGMFDFCQQTACSEHCNFALIWDPAFQAEKSFSRQEKVSCKKRTAATSETPSTVSLR